MEKGYLFHFDGTNEEGADVPAFDPEAGEIFKS